jgi:hypothetical protein
LIPPFISHFCNFRLRTQKDVNPLIGRKLTGKKYLHWLPPIPQSELRSVRHLLGGVTVNDLVSTATSRAVWRYMASLPPHEQERVPFGKPWTLSDSCAVALWTKFPKKFKNQFGICRLKARTAGDNKQLTPLEDLAARRAEVKTHVKTLHLGMGSFIGMSWLPNKAPTCIVDKIVAPPDTNTYCFSNVRTPPHAKMHLFGVPASRSYAFPPQCGISGLYRAQQIII